MVRVGIIGNGIIAQAHRQAYADLQADGVEVEIVAVSDIRPECTEKCEGERKYGDYKELLEAEQGKLDYVDICLPTYLHSPASILALEMGYHVMCEKPMAINYEAAVAMCEAAKRTGKTLMIALSFRFGYICDAVREYVASGEFGKVVTACFKRDVGVPGGRWEDWMYEKDRCGGAILDMHMHDVDALQSIFGVPEAVSTGAVNRIPGSGYDQVTSIYHYPNGFYTTSTTCWGLGPNKYAGDAETVIFEKGYIYYGTFDGKNVFVAVDAEGNEKQLTPPGYKNGYYREAKYFMECITSGKPVEFCLPESSAESVRIIMAENESADKNGERIAL